jgi:hypothetical protein
LTRGLARPSGWPPPTEARAPGGRIIDLLALAREVCRRYRAEYPDEQERYGDAGVAWCVHDNQHILNWAILAAYEGLDLRAQVSWLARVLEARDFPLDRLARDLELAADVTREEAAAGPEIAGMLAVEAAFVRSRPSFLAQG